MIQIQFPAEKQGRNAAVDSCAGQRAHCLVPPATQQRCHTGQEGDTVDKVMEQASQMQSHREPGFISPAACERGVFNNDGWKFCFLWALKVLALQTVPCMAVPQIILRTDTSGKGSRKKACTVHPA